MTKKLETFLAAAMCVFALAACEGPEGPAGPTGPAGPEGPAGPAGPAGAAGQDANENCTQCHTESADLFAVQLQYQSSLHRTGDTFARNGASCASCHTHQGFIEYLETGDVAAAVDNPAPTNCATCHQIHTTYTAADYALTVSDEPFSTVNASTEIDLDAGNLCATCHQGRPIAARTSAPVVIDGPPVTITSSRYGFHHGPQAQVVGGVEAFEFTGSRTVTGGIGHPAYQCADCHMGVVEGGIELGGHTWRMTFGAEGNVDQKISSCTDCHSSATSFDLAGIQTNVENLLVQIETILVNEGVKQALSTDYTKEGLNVYANTGEFPANLVAAMGNWQLFAEDRSLGVHNPGYTVAVLTNTLEAITPAQ